MPLDSEQRNRLLAAKARAIVGEVTSIEPILAAIASAIASVWRDAQIPEQLMQLLPELLRTLSTIKSR